MEDENWISSKKVKLLTKIKGCDLMHYRTEGRLEFKKRGNAYLYSKNSVEKLKISMTKSDKD